MGVLELAGAVGRVTIPEGPAPAPALAMCDEMSLSMWACWAGVKPAVSVVGADVPTGDSDGVGDGSVPAGRRG